MLPHLAILGQNWSSCETLHSNQLEGTYWIIWIPVDLHDQVPEGDWFCPFCVKEQRRATKAKAAPKVKAKAREVMEKVTMTRTM